MKHCNGLKYIALLLLSLVALQPIRAQQDVGVAVVSFYAGNGLTRQYAENLVTDFAIYIHNADPQQFPLYERKDVHRALNNISNRFGKLTKEQTIHVAGDLDVAYVLVGDVSSYNGMNKLTIKIINAHEAKAYYTDEISWRSNLPTAAPLIQLAERTAKRFANLPLPVYVKQSAPVVGRIVSVSNDDALTDDEKAQREAWRKEQASWLQSQNEDNVTENVSSKRQQREAEDARLRQEYAVVELPSNQRTEARDNEFAARAQREKDQQDSLALADLERRRLENLQHELKKQQELEMEKGKLVFTIGDVTFEMLYIQGGTFTMGDYEHGERDEYPEHQVTVGDFYLAPFEVTQQLWNAVMYTNIERQASSADAGELVGVGDKMPMYYVSYEEAQRFVKELSRQTGMSFRLPTEAEWEYAAKGGKYQSKTRFAGSDVLDFAGWNAVNSGSQVHEVGTKMPNALGLYDMSGNVAEWCRDWYFNGYYGVSSSLNPQGPAKGIERVVRGGNFNMGKTDTRITNRNHRPANAHYATIGFRIAMNVPVE